MPLVVVHVVERSTFEGNAPTADQLARAFRNVSLGFGADRSGRWVSGTPRITRRLVGRVTGDLETHAAGLYEFPATDWTQQHITYLRNSLRDGVAATVRAAVPDAALEPVELLDHSPRLHGSREWWASGRAAVTRTRNSFPTGTGRLYSDENPIGPTTGQSPPGIAETLERAVSGLTPLLWVVVAAMVLPAVVQGMQTARPREANPRRRKRKNPQPLAWLTMGPDQPYGSAGKYQGRKVPGRQGGLILASATPRREDYEPIAGTLTPRKGSKSQYWLGGEGGLPGVGWTMPRARAQRRMRSGPRCDRQRDKAASVGEYDLAEQLSRADLEGAAWVPGATELEFPHSSGASVCCDHHALWEAQRAALEAMPRGMDPDAARAALERHSLWPAWEGAWNKCLDDWHKRAERQRATVYESPKKRRARLREQLLRTGLDEGGAEFRDLVWLETERGR